MKKLLWLDDNRNPSEGNWLAHSPIEKPFEVIWLKSYVEFTEWITKNGLPDAICFDHDLGIEASLEEKTGYDCAKWLVDYCLDNKLKLPKWNAQSNNPAGKDNINGLLVSFIKHME